jgi:hypothetical protein
VCYTASVCFVRSRVNDLLLQKYCHMCEAQIIWLAIVSLVRIHLKNGWMYAHFLCLFYVGESFVTSRSRGSYHICYRLNKERILFLYELDPPGRFRFRTDFDTVLSFIPSTVFGRSNIGIAGSNPGRGMDVCLCFCMFVLSCV